MQEFNDQDYKFDEKFFVDLLEKLIGESYYLQNKSPDFVPCEDKAGAHILEALKPYSTENGGPLQIRHIHYDEKKQRGNIIIKYPATAEKRVGKEECISIVGCHLDVVYADEKNWDKDHPPFKLTKDETGNKLFGRGTTDCLGHCAVVTDIFKQLATKKPTLNIDIVGVIIVDEEDGSAQIGVDQLMKNNELDDLKKGPLYWLDCADKQPNIGTAGVIQWQIVAKGKLSHAGFPQNGINAIELLNDAIIYLQKKFYEQFKPHEKEKEYGFACSSSFKPTVMNSIEGSTNQIPSECTAQGEIRLVPFYNIEDAIKLIEDGIKELNDTKFKELQDYHFRGPDSKYVIETSEGKFEGLLTLKWNASPIQGLACDLTSFGYKCLCEATKQVVGEVKPYSVTGALPLVADLQRFGFDVQCTGFGVESAYHNDNEYMYLSDAKQGFEVLMKIISFIQNGKIGQ